MRYVLTYAKDTSEYIVTKIGMYSDVWSIHQSTYSQNLVCPLICTNTSTRICTKLDMYFDMWKIHQSTYLQNSVCVLMCKNTSMYIFTKLDMYFDRQEYIEVHIYEIRYVLWDVKIHQSTYLQKPISSLQKIGKVQIYVIRYVLWYDKKTSK